MTSEKEPYLTVQDVYNVITEHLAALDTLWPDADQFGPRKVHVVELIDAIKLRLVQRAEKNADRYESPFERAARKITGSGKILSPPPQNTQEPASKTAMQMAHEEARARMRGR